MLVSDPEDPDADCEELGAAALDLHMVSPQVNTALFCSTNSTCNALCFRY